MLYIKDGDGENSHKEKKKEHIESLKFHSSALGNERKKPPILKLCLLKKKRNKYFQSICEDNSTIFVSYEPQT